MNTFYPQTPPEPKFFRIDAKAAGFDLAELERALRRGGRQFGWPVLQSAARLLRLDPEKVDRACALCEERIQGAIDANAQAITEARQRANAVAREQREAAEAAKKA